MADPTPRTGIAAIARDAARSRARIGEMERFSGTQRASTTLTARTALEDAGTAQRKAVSATELAEDAGDLAQVAQADALEAAGAADEATATALVADERAQAAARAAQAASEAAAALDGKVQQARDAADAASAAAAQVRTDASDALDDVEAALVQADEGLALAAKDAYDKAEAARATADASKVASDAATTAADKATTAATRAQQTADNAVTSSAFNINPHLDDWTGDYPVGWKAWNGVAIRETALSRSKPYSVRFPAAVNVNAGMEASGLLAALPLDLEYLVIELDVMMVSGTSLSGAGVLVDWQGKAVPNRAFIKLGDEIPSPQLNKWYRVVKTLRRPSGTGTVTGWSTWLMANWGELTTPTMAAKEVIFDRIVYRPATSEEIKAIQAEASAAAAKSAADAAQKTATDAQSTATTAQTAANGKNKNIYSETAPFYDGTTAGDMWWVRLQNTGLILGQYEWTAAGAWERRTMGDSVIANLDAGKITTGYLAAARIAANTIIAQMLASDAVLARHIKAGEIIAGKLGADSVVAGNVATDAITAREILAGSVSAIELSADAINGKTITGVTIKTLTAGQRIELEGSQLRVYDQSGTFSGYIYGDQSALVVQGPVGGIEIGRTIGSTSYNVISRGRNLLNVIEAYSVVVTDNPSSNEKGVAIRTSTGAGALVTALTNHGINIKSLNASDTWAASFGVTLPDNTKAGVFADSVATSRLTTGAGGTDLLPHIARYDVTPGQEGLRQNGAVKNTPPAGTRLIRKIKFEIFQTTSAGLPPARRVFDTAFPNACLYVNVTTVGGTGVSPVLNGGDVDRFGFMPIWVGGGNSPVQMVYEAVGW